LRLSQRGRWQIRGGVIRKKRGRTPCKAEIARRLRVLPPRCIRLSSRKRTACSKFEHVRIDE
jgi:hypothetical protein